MGFREKWWSRDLDEGVGGDGGDDGGGDDDGDDDGDGGGSFDGNGGGDGPRAGGVESMQVTGHVKARAGECVLGPIYERA